jgi:threonine/homoserine/homoserine lactone efflux protein
MLRYVLFGSGLAFAAVIQPGPLQAFLFSRVTAVGWRRTLPACLAPLLSDGPIALVSIFVLGQLSLDMQCILKACGGAYLFYIAWTTMRQLRVSTETVTQIPPPSTMFQAALVNLLNPNPYLGWTLVLGPSVLNAWNNSPANAIALLAAFYGTMVAMLAMFIFLVGTTSFLGQRRRRSLVALSALVLAFIGAYLLVTSVQTLFYTPRLLEAW